MKIVEVITANMSAWRIGRKTASSTVAASSPAAIGTRK